MFWAGSKRKLTVFGGFALWSAIIGTACRRARKRYGRGCNECAIWRGVRKLSDPVPQTPDDLCGITRPYPPIACPIPAFVCNEKRHNLASVRHRWRQGCPLLPLGKVPRIHKLLTHPIWESRKFRHILTCFSVIKLYNMQSGCIVACCAATLSCFPSFRKRKEKSCLLIRRTELLLPN